MARASCNNQNFYFHSQLEVLLVLTRAGCRRAFWILLSFLPPPVLLVAIFDSVRVRVLEGRAGKRPKRSYLADTAVRWHWGFKSGSSCHGLFVSFFIELHWWLLILLPKVWVILLFRDSFFSAWLFPHQPLISVPQLGLPCTPPPDSPLQPYFHGFQARLTFTYLTHTDESVPL